MLQASEPEQKDESTQPRLRDRVLVWSLSDTDAYTLECLDWYDAGSLSNVQILTAQFIEGQLDLFGGLFGESFSLAEYPDVLDQLQPPEIALFLKAADAPEDTDFSSVGDYDCYSGLCSIIAPVRTGLARADESRGRPVQLDHRMWAVSRRHQGSRRH